MGNKTRFYSLALGREKNFNARTAGLWNEGSNISFINHNSSWYELSRSSAGGAKTVTVAVGDYTPSVAGIELVVLNSAGAFHISDFDDASEGQQITVLNLGVASSLLNDVTKVVIAASGAALIMASSQAYQLVSNSGIWYLTSSTRTTGLI